MVTITDVQAMLEKMVKALVESGGEVVISPIEGDNTVVFEVQVNSEDTGKVIGKKGRTINALRTILRSTKVAGDKKLMMELV